MRYTVADLPESGRWVVIREADGREVCEAATEEEARRLARVLDARRVESASPLPPSPAAGERAS